VVVTTFFPARNNSLARQNIDVVFPPAPARLITSLVSRPNDSDRTPAPSLSLGSLYKLFDDRTNDLLMGIHMNYQNILKYKPTPWFDRLTMMS
jgi:hypothetical protein